MPVKLANNASSLLAADIAAGDTSLSVTAGDGALFPTLAAGDWFPATLVDADGNREIIKVTARATDVLTIERGQESTTARSYASGSRIDLRMTAGSFAEFLTAGANLSDLDDAATARDSLGLGDSATKDVGTAAGTVAAGDDARIVGAAQAADNLSDLDDAATARDNLGLGDVAVLDKATKAQILANTAEAAIATNEAWLAAKWVDLGNITGDVTLDASTGAAFHGVLTGNVTIDVSNLKDGQSIDFAFYQDSTGGRTVSWNTKIKFPNAVAPVVGTTASANALVGSLTGTWDTTIVQGNGWHN